MEVVDSAGRPGAELVEVAFAETREEGELVRGLLTEAQIRSIARPLNIEGPQIGEGLLVSSPQAIFVRPEDAVAARELLRETMVEEPPDEIPESINARYLAEAEPGSFGAAGRGARNYSLLGAFARFYLVAFVVIGLVLLVFLALH